MTRIHLNDYFSESVRKNWDRMALTDFDGASYQYKDVARKIAKIMPIVSAFSFSIMVMTKEKNGSYKSLRISGSLNFSR